MKRLLIANRGEIARRIIRTAHAMGIETVAVFSEPDAGALHVREATSAYALGGAASADSYLRIDRLLDAAVATNADAIHPGYGFLSENADFAQAVIDAGLTWVGPPPKAIRALGSKSAAKALAVAQGVPCLPGYFGDDQSEATFEAEARRVGFPLMVKAVAGGGGRGMRLVHEAAQLLPALRSARSEALAGFANGDLLIERARGHLVAQQPHDLGLRPDEGDAGLRTRFREVRVLGQEAVARVDGIDLRLQRDADHVVDVEVGLDGLPAGPDQIALVGLEAVEREAVFVGEDGHRADAHLGSRAHDADGDLGTVGDEQAADGFHGVVRFDRGSGSGLTPVCGEESPLGPPVRIIAALPRRSMAFAAFRCGKEDFAVREVRPAQFT